jgi:hypothetical protein
MFLKKSKKIPVVLHQDNREYTESGKLFCQLLLHGINTVSGNGIHAHGY